MQQSTLVPIDIGGVLLNPNYTGLFEAGARIMGIAPEEFKRLYNTSGIEPLALNGDIPYEEQVKRLKEFVTYHWLPWESNPLRAKINGFIDNLYSNAAMNVREKEEARDIESAIGREF